MSFQELLTCVRERIPVTAVVFHNGQWGAEKKNQVDFYGRRFVGSNLQNPNFAELARAMGAEGLRVEHADQVGDALRAACKAQSEGKTTVLEMMVSQELGDPFRRDALKQPVRFLKKYQPYVNQPFASGKRRCRSSRRDTRREDGRAPDPEVRMRSRGSGSGDPARPADASATSGPAARRRPARRAGGASRSEKDGERWIVRAAARCRIVGGPAAHGGGISLVRVQPGRGGSGARGRLYRAGAGGAARASRGCWRNRACRPAGWKSSTRPTTSWNRRGPRRRWRATPPWACDVDPARRVHAVAACCILTDAAVNIAPTLAEGRHRAERHRPGALAGRGPAQGGGAVRDRIGESVHAGHAGRGGPVQDGRPDADTRRAGGRAAGAGQRHFARGGGAEGHRLAGGGAGRHPAGARYRGRQHALQGTHLAGRRGRGRAGAGHACRSC